MVAYCMGGSDRQCGPEITLIVIVSLPSIVILRVSHLGFGEKV